MDSNAVLRLARLLESKSSGTAQIQIPDTLDREIAKLIAKQRTCKADKLDPLVKALGAKDGTISARLATRAFILIFAILRSAEPCSAQFRGLILLAESFNQEMHAFSATQSSLGAGPASTWISRKKARLGEQLFEKALQQLCNEDVNLGTRRWMGILALELIHDCEENQHLLQEEAPERRIKLSQLALSSKYPVLQFVAVRILRTMIAAGAPPHLFDTSGTQGVVFSDFATSKTPSFEAVFGYYAWLQQTAELLPRSNCLSGVICIENIFVETAPNETKYLQASRDGLLMCGQGNITILSIVDGQDTFMDLPLDAVQSCDLNTGQPGTLHSAQLQLSAPIFVNARPFYVAQIVLQMSQAEHLGTIQSLLSPLKHQVVLPASGPGGRHLTPNPGATGTGIFTPLADRTRPLCVAAESPMDVGQHIQDLQPQDEAEIEALRISNQLMKDIAFDETSGHGDAARMVQDSQATEATVLALTKPRTTRSGRPIIDPLPEDELMMLSAEALALVHVASSQNANPIVADAGTTFARDKKIASKALAKDTPPQIEQTQKQPRKSRFFQNREIETSSNSIFDIESSDDERPAPKAPQKPKSVPRNKAKSAQKSNTKVKRSQDITPPETPVPARKPATKQLISNPATNVESGSRPTRRAAQVATEKIKGMSSMARLDTQKFFAQQHQQAEAEKVIPPSKNPRDKTKSPSRDGSILSAGRKQKERLVPPKRTSPKVSQKKAKRPSKEKTRKPGAAQEINAESSDIIMIGDDEDEQPPSRNPQTRERTTAKSKIPDIAVLPAAAPSPVVTQPHLNPHATTPQINATSLKANKPSIAKSARKADPVAEKLKSALACLLSPELVSNTNHHEYSATRSPSERNARIFSPAQQPSSTVHKTSTPVVASTKNKAAVSRESSGHETDGLVEIISAIDVGDEAVVQSPRSALREVADDRVPSPESPSPAAAVAPADKPVSATKPWLLSKEAQTASARKKAETRSSEKKRRAELIKKNPLADISTSSQAKHSQLAILPRRSQIRVTQEGSPLPREVIDDAPRLSLFMEETEPSREASIILGNDEPVLENETLSQEEIVPPDGEHIDVSAQVLAQSDKSSSEQPSISSDELAESSPFPYETSPQLVRSLPKQSRVTPAKSVGARKAPKIQTTQQIRVSKTMKRKMPSDTNASETSSSAEDELSGGFVFQKILNTLDASHQKKRRVRYEQVEIDDSQQEREAPPVTTKSKKTPSRTRPSKARHATARPFTKDRVETSSALLEGLLNDLGAAIKRHFGEQEKRTRDKLHKYKMREFAALQRRASEQAAQHEYWIKSADKAKTEIVRDLQKLDNAIVHKWKKHRDLDLTNSYDALTASREALDTVYPELLALMT